MVTWYDWWSLCEEDQRCVWLWMDTFSSFVTAHIRSVHVYLIVGIFNVGNFSPIFRSHNVQNGNFADEICLTKRCGCLMRDAEQKINRRKTNFALWTDIFLNEIYPLYGTFAIVHVHVQLHNIPYSQLANYMPTQNYSPGGQWRKWWFSSFSSKKRAIESLVL